MKTRNPVLDLFRLVFAACLAIVVLAAVGWALPNTGLSRWTVPALRPALIALFASLALYSMGHPALKYYAFTFWVFAFVAASMGYPVLFLTWRGFDLKFLIVPLIQIIMFGMGTTLSLADFGRVLKMPWPVFIALVAHFVIMPLTGFTLARMFGFSGEIAAGIVLIGSCPSGVASNVMTYLAHGNVALAVTITSCSTLAAPVLTPLLMQQLAGRFVAIPFAAMMLDIINMIIVPIVAGLFANRILYGKHRLLGRGAVLAAIGCACAAAAAVMIALMPRDLFPVWGTSFQKDGLIVGLVLIAAVAWAKLIVRVWLSGPERWMDKALPVASMLAICCIIAVITARSRNELLAVGPLLIVVTILHNGIGYLLGYWVSRLLRLEESWCRTVAFEVGMQNGGLASALAMKTLQSAPAALAPAIFGPWQNVSGSILATFWHRRPVAGAVSKSVEDVPQLAGERH